MNADKDLLYSESVKAGKRIYYFDVKQNRKGDKYVSITESKRLATDNDSDSPIVYERHKIFLYNEDFDKFIGAFEKVIEVARQQDSVQSKTADSDVEP